MGGVLLGEDDELDELLLLDEDEELLGEDDVLLDEDGELLLDEEELGGGELLEELLLLEDEELDEEGMGGRGVFRRLSELFCGKKTDGRRVAPGTKGGGIVRVQVADRRREHHDVARRLGVTED